jgi:hypothetical protein
MLGNNISRLMNKCEPITSCVIATIPELCTEDLDLPLPATYVFIIGLGFWQLCRLPLYNALSPTTKKTNTYILFTITMHPMKMHKQSI